MQALHKNSRIQKDGSDGLFKLQTTRKLVNNHFESLTSISYTSINSSFKSIVFFSAGNFAQKQEMENKQFAADENKTVCSDICICTMSSLNSFIAIL